MSDSSSVNLRVQVYEDNDELRSMLSMLLEHSSGFELCGAFADCTDVLLNLSEKKPDVILCDIDMPGVNGIEGVRLIRSQNKEVLILMYTVFDDNEHLFE